MQADETGEEQLVDLLNQSRREHGLPPLAVDSRLTQAARAHTELMVQHSALAHQFPGEPSLQVRFANDGLPSDRQSENVALNQNITSAHEALLHSPPHRRAILDPGYDVVGVGVIHSGGDIYVTEDFAHKLLEYSEQQAEALAQTAIERYARSRGFLPQSRHQQRELRHLACTMALNDALNSGEGLRFPGVRNVLAWTASDPAQLPKGMSTVLSSQVSGYAVGACFAPSVSHPGGAYWLVMVTY